MSSTLTFTSCPISSTSDGWFTCDHESSEMWISPSIPSRSTNAPKSTMFEIVPSTTSPGLSRSRIAWRISLRSSSRTARRESTTLFRERLSSITLQRSSWPMNSSRSCTRRMSTSDAGRKPRTPRSRMRPPLTTSMTRPVTGSPCSCACSIAFQASSKRARFEIAWKAIEQAHEQGEPVTGRVIEVVKGGLILDLGVRGFLPASLVDIRRVQDLDEYMSQELRCKVIELNRSRNNVVLSRRAVLEDERKEMRQAILDRLNPGDVVEGTISNIVDFGAFVDLEGMDGLIHISELSWSHVNHPSEVLEIGQKVQVKVLDIDRDRQRISLGLKQTQTDPWQQVVESYQEGDVVEGKVTKVVTFGAFVEILPGVEGLVHISELAQHHVENPREVVAQGDTVPVLILEVDAERRRLSLSLKRVDPERRAENEAPIEGTPHLDLSEDVFADAAAAPPLPAEEDASAE